MPPRWHIRGCRPKKSKFHESIYVGLVNSVLKGSDGNTPKTAYHVISAGEEYVLLNALELKRGPRPSKTPTATYYHLITANDKATNEPVKVYFNIDKIRPTLAAVPKDLKFRVQASACLPGGITNVYGVSKPFPLETVPTVPRVSHASRGTNNYLYLQ